MKKLFLLSFFIITTLASSAQRFEVSEQAGASFCSASSVQNNGFGNQVAIGYRPLRYLEVSAFYELNKWTSFSNSVGVSADFTSRYFFVGLEGKYTSVNPYIDNSYGQPYRTGFTYSSVLGYGVHAGSKQKLSKRFSLVEQIGYVWVPLTQYFENIGPSHPNINVFYGRIYGTVFRLQGGVDYLYARIGLSYRL